MPNIRVYGADWCPLTKRTLAWLQENHFDFEYIDVEQDQSASAWVKKQNHGKEKKPTVDIDGIILSEPTNQELESALSGMKP